MLFCNTLFLVAVWNVYLDIKTLLHHIAWCMCMSSSFLFLWYAYYIRNHDCACLSLFQRMLVSFCMILEFISAFISLWFDGWSFGFAFLVVLIWCSAFTVSIKNLTNGVDCIGLRCLVTASDV